MTKICMVFNHFQISDGVAKSAVGIANLLKGRGDVEICLRPLFIYDKSIRNLLPDSVKVKPLFGFYFRGFAKIIDLLPSKLLYKLVIREKYDIEIGFQFGLSTKAIANSTNKEARRYIWMHTYDDGLTQREDYIRADRMVCVSRCNAERLAKEINADIPVDYCYNAIEDTVIQQMGRQACDIDKNGRFTFVTVGRLSPEKGYSRLLDCIARLKQEGYRFNLWLIGKGAEETHLRDKVKQLDIADMVSLLGEQKNPHKFTALADVFVCSSFSEGYSTACTEAVILGVPVLTTSVSGGEEIIDSSEAGMLVGMEDEDLYRGMKAILDDPEMVSGWKKTLENTKQRFYQSARAEKLMEVLELS